MKILFKNCQFWHYELDLDGKITDFYSIMFRQCTVFEKSFRKNNWHRVNCLRLKKRRVRQIKQFCVSRI
jgi:hypothetical protein